MCAQCGSLRHLKNEINFYEYDDVEMVSGHCIHSFPVHIHEHGCVGFVTEGCAELIKGDNRTILTAGDGYVIPPYTPHALSSVAFKRFRYVVLCCKRADPRDRANDIVSEAKARIRQTTGNFCVGTLSQEVHISKYHLDRIFKAQVGVTPYQFYLHHRIKKIRQGLQMHIPLSDLVYSLHFTDQSHLCNTFKKHMGISPAQYAASYHARVKATPV